MLILSRKHGEKLIINDNIVLTILENTNGTVKLGIDAPMGVKIYREEVYNAVKEANTASNDITINSLDELNKITALKDSKIKLFKENK